MKEKEFACIPSLFGVNVFNETAMAKYVSCDAVVAWKQCLKDGTPLPYAIVSVEAYSEGYAVAQASNGLYGYVDEEGLWVLSAIYEKALPVSEGYANVVYNGREMTVAVS